MATSDHYKTLGISPKASQQEIKEAYRRLAKQFHPDTKNEGADHDRIVQLNQAYEILGDRPQRALYDQQRHASTFRGIRQPQATAVKHEKSNDTDLALWIREIYQPIRRLVDVIICPLKQQIDELAADPFDDELMEAFQSYLEECQVSLELAQTILRSLPNPMNLARVAQDLYYCLNHLGDGLEQFEWFTLNYSEDYLHTGQEMFRRADQFSFQAHQAIAKLI